MDACRERSKDIRGAIAHREQRNALPFGEQSRSVRVSLVPYHDVVGQLHSLAKLAERRAEVALSRSDEHEHQKYCPACEQD